LKRRLSSDWGLARIALARLLPPSFWLPFAGFLLLTLWVWRRESLTGIRQEPWLERAQLRQSAWVLLACLGAPIMIVRSASLAQSWRRLDADWFGALPIGRWRWVLGAGSGVLLASVLLSSSTAILTELAIAEDAPCGRFERSFQHAGFNLVNGDGPAEWIQGDLLLDQVQAGSKLIFRPSVAPGAGPSVELAFHALEAQQSITENQGTRALIFGRSRVQVELPAGATGPAKLAMQRISEGAPAILPANHVDLVAALGTERWISAELALWALVFLVAWSSLAAGLGAWMRPGLAAGLCLASIGLAWWGETYLGFLPGAAAPAAWTHLGQGWAPGPMDTSVWLGAGTMLAAGLGLLGAGIARGRHLA
jgi:hypothetical protein